MFGSTSPFGQSSSSLFGSPSPFGHANNASINPFAPKPFGSQSGGSIFGSTVTGVFGATQAASSAPAFGTSATPAFVSSPFGSSSSTPAFGSSLFGQKPAFGGFGSSPSQGSPFGGTFQQSQPAFGSSLFGSTSPFGVSSPPAFGATSTPAFGGTSTPAFGASSAPAFGSTTANPFGSTSSPFGISTPAFGVSSTPAFGASSAPVFGASSTPAFGASSTTFGFGSSPAFGQSTPTFGSTTFGTTPFGAQSSPFGTQTTAPTFGSTNFGQSGFGSQQLGSRVVAYSPTPEDGGIGTTGQTLGKLESISAMPAYKEKSHEELRWEDYQKGDKGGPSPASQPSFGQSSQSSLFATSAFGQATPNPFSSTTSTGLFGSKPATFGFTSSSSSLPFGSSSSSPFGATSTSSIFGAPSTPAFGATTSPFGVASTPAFSSSSSSLFGSTSAPASIPTFGSGLTFGSTQSSGLFQSSSPSFGQSSTFGQSTFGQSGSAFGQSNPFSTRSTGFGANLFPSNSLLSTGFGQTTPSLATGFQSIAPAQSSGSFSFSNFGQTQPAGSNGFGGISNAFGQNTLGQPTAMQNVAIMQPSPANPFGILPAMPQISIDRQGTAPLVQYGISNMPVVDKPVAVRISPLLVSRHVSRRSGISLPSRKYHPKEDTIKMSFLTDDEGTSTTPKADTLLIPRENPRALIIKHAKQWRSAPVNKQNQLDKQSAFNENENGKLTDGRPASSPLEDESAERQEKAADHDISLGKANAKNASPPLRETHKQNGVGDNQSKKGDGYISLSGHRAGEAAIVFEYGARIEALMPKLRHADYYTEPKIQELASRERDEPGYCKHVKDFVVGRRGYGSIKFFGETDVRRLDIESIVQFNNREVLVYMDGVKKPPIGQGLNKPGEVTLLNVRCVDKKTGEVVTKGPLVEKYAKLLMKKAQEQGAEFVSFDAVNCEWKFKVDHFSRYGMS